MQACTFDIASFHCTCSVLPSHKPWLVVQGQLGSFYIDHSHPFGALSASSNAGMIANAAVNIWEAEGIHLICKYEDDLKIFHFPSLIPRVNFIMTMTQPRHCIAYLLWVFHGIRINAMIHFPSL